MKFCIIQPAYSFAPEDADACFDGVLALLSRCDETMDAIVLPEYCDIPAATANGEQYHAFIENYNARIRTACRDTARRCHALVFANYGEKCATGWRNTTHVLDRDGSEIGQYFKAHPAPSEVKTFAQGGNQVDCSYSWSYAPPCIVEVEGIRFAFLTCYDFYMYESFASIARLKPDVIIGCSHQRTDSRNALDLIGRFLSYNTNAYLVRSSVTLGEDSPVCGCSMVVSPKGEMLLNMEGRPGLAVCDIDPHDKYYKPAGFRGALRSHPEYIDEGRRPWLYRPGGSMMVPSDRDMPYPRLCAHRGFSAVCPENSMPSFGAAVALGAKEFEFDVWSTRDGELVSIHDPTLERVSNGEGKVWEHTYAELQELDFGCKRPGFEGVRIPKFEEILQKFACTAVMNIHVKIWGKDLDPQYQRIADLLRQYDCERHCYIMTNADAASAEFHKIAPEIHRCVGFDGVKDQPLRMIDRALAIGAEKVQLFKPNFTDESFRYAHENGILCNVFYADDPDEALAYFRMGADCVLTNNFVKVRNALVKQGVQL